jgi:hypothetical protein
MRRAVNHVLRSWRCARTKIIERLYRTTDRARFRTSTLQYFNTPTPNRNHERQRRGRGRESRQQLARSSQGCQRRTREHQAVQQCV